MSLAAERMRNTWAALARFKNNCLDPGFPLERLRNVMLKLGTSRPDPQVLRRPRFAQACLRARKTLSKQARMYALAFQSLSLFYIQISCVCVCRLGTKMKTERRRSEI